MKSFSKKISKIGFSLGCILLASLSFAKAQETECQGDVTRVRIFSDRTFVSSPYGGSDALENLMGRWNIKWATGQAPKWQDSTRSDLYPFELALGGTQVPGRKDFCVGQLYRGARENSVFAVISISCFPDWCAASTCQPSNLIRNEQLESAVCVER